MGFDEGEVLRDDMQDSLYKNAEASNLMIDGDLSKEKDNEKMDIDLNAPVKDDGFGDAGIDGGMFGKNWNNKNNKNLENFITLSLLCLYNHHQKASTVA